MMDIRDDHRPAPGGWTASGRSARAAGLVGTIPLASRFLRLHPDEQRRLLRFLIVGSLITLGYSVVASILVTFLGAPPWPTAVILSAICIPIGFFSQRNFTFRSSVPLARGFAGYGGTQITAIALTSLVTTAFVSDDALLNALVYAATAGISALASYFICKYLVFR